LKYELKRGRSEKNGTITVRPINDRVARGKEIRKKKELGKKRSKKKKKTEGDWQPTCRFTEGKETKRGRRDIKERLGETKKLTCGKC